MTMSWATSWLRDSAYRWAKCLLIPPMCARRISFSSIRKMKEESRKIKKRREMRIWKNSLKMELEAEILYGLSMRKMRDLVMIRN